MRYPAPPAPLVAVRLPVSFEHVIDVRRLRVDLDATKAALARKGVPGSEVERVATLDVEHRRLAREAEEVRAGKGPLEASGRRHEGRRDGQSRGTAGREPATWQRTGRS